MKLFIIHIILLLPLIDALCPGSSTIEPCECGETNGTITLFCQSVELSPLTSILRNQLCGRTIGSFYLRAPNIDHLPSNLFYKNIVFDVQIENANISHFTQAGRSAFYGQEPHLKVLSMRRCNPGHQLRWEMISELRALSYLDLSYNKLKSVPRHWFHYPPPSLRSLILKGNQISVLESGSFRYMHTLNELDLSNNQIQEVKRDIFPYPGNELIFLRLSDNSLRTLPEDIFDEMFGLRRLYLDNNKLTTLSENTWKPVWGELERLELYGNPLKCSCELQWMWEYRPPQQLYGSCCIIDNSNTTAVATECPSHRQKELRKLYISDFDLWSC